MLYTVIKENMYQDSVSLMLLTKKLSTVEGVNQISVMMGTPANKEIFENTGLLTKEIENAKAGDICIVIDTEKEDLIDDVLAEIQTFLSNQSSNSNKTSLTKVRSWSNIHRHMKDPDIALISIAGHYAVEEAHKALDADMHTFIFSDNISKEDERALKVKAAEKGLLVMGPDCGTGIIGGIPLAFANVINEGNIGIVGASGTGIQEVTTIIHKLGGGITHAIGTGGRDLSEEIQAITAIEALKGLHAHDETDVIVFISKPPHPTVRDEVIKVMQKFSKPVVAIFLGEKLSGTEGNITYAWNLEQAAREAISLSKEKREKPVDSTGYLQTQTGVLGLYSGGTLAYEAAMMLREYVGADPSEKAEDGFVLRSGNHTVMDLGDDIYTQGRPHPMIDPSVRVEKMKEVAERDDIAVVLFDIVLGYGSHENMAAELIPAITEVKEKMENQGRNIAFVATVCGTDKDPQPYMSQIKALHDAGVIVKSSNYAAVRTAINVIKAIELPKASSKVTELLSKNPKYLNIGLPKFAETIKEHGGEVLQFDWRPIAGGNKELAKILAVLK